MSENNLLIFDLDGTLVDSRRDIAEAVNHAITSLGSPPFDESQIAELLGFGLFKTVNMALDRLGSNVDRREAEELTKDYYSKNPVVYTTLYPSVAKTLCELKRMGCYTALLTNKVHEIAESILEKLNILPYFDFVIGAYRGFDFKPSPDGIQYLITKCAVSKDHAFMVGDSDVDLATAKNGEIRAIQVTYGYGVVTLKPDFVIDTFEELVPLISSVSE